MTRDDILRMAREAGAKPGIENEADAEFLECFANMIEAAASADEREQCAQIAEAYGPGRQILHKHPSERIKGRWEGEQAASSGIAAAIRARGQA